MEDDGQLQAAGQADVLPEDLVLGVVVRGGGQEVQADLADADDFGRRSGHPLKFGVDLIGDLVTGLHGVYANAGIEEFVLLGQVDTVLGGLQCGPGAHRERHACFPGPRQYLGHLRRRVFVQVSVAVSQQKIARHHVLPHRWVDSDQVECHPQPFAQVESYTMVTNQGEIEMYIDRFGAEYFEIGPIPCD